jgi:hypothetical protein
VDAFTLFWGTPNRHVMFVQRKGTTVERFPNVQQDGTWIRAASRLGLAFLNEAGVVRGYDALTLGRGGPAYNVRASLPPHG